MLIEMDHGLAQTQEIEALQAIYGDDFEKRPGIWNCPAFAIKVRPVCLIDEGVNAWITLTVKVRGMHACCRRLLASKLSNHLSHFLVLI